MHFSLLILMISILARSGLGQDEFFWKVGYGFDEGRQMAGWGNRNQWLQQVRGAKHSPSLKELEKWWNHPLKNPEPVGNHGNNDIDDRPRPDSHVDERNPGEFNNEGFSSPNWNFGPISPTKDPFPPFTKDAALRIKDYAALLKAKKHSEHSGKAWNNWDSRGKAWNSWDNRGIRGPRNNKDRVPRFKKLRAHKFASQSSPSCWHPLAYECDSSHANISPVSEYNTYLPQFDGPADFYNNNNNNEYRDEPRDWPSNGGFSPVAANWNAFRDYDQGHVSYSNSQGHRQNEDWHNWAPKIKKKPKSKFKFSNPFFHTTQVVIPQKGNHFKQNNKYTNWRPIHNEPVSWDNKYGGYSLGYTHNPNSYGRRAKPHKSTWIAPVYSWNQAGHELSPMTKHRAHLHNHQMQHHHNPSGHYDNHYNNINWSPVQQNFAHQSSPVSPKTLWNSPLSEDWTQIGSSWSNDINQLISQARSNVF